MNKIFIIAILFLLVGCQTPNVFDVGSRFKLQGDYSKGELMDLEEDMPSYIPLYKITCTENADKCLMVMEIDYKIFYDNLTNMFKMCDVNLEEMDYEEMTEEQINCSRKIAETIGFGNIDG